MLIVAEELEILHFLLEYRHKPYYLRVKRISLKVEIEHHIKRFSLYILLCLRNRRRLHDRHRLCDRRFFPLHLHRGSRRLLFDRLRRRCFRLFRESGLFCFSEYKFRFFRRIRRILRAANKNIRHAASFLRIPVSNRNDHKITDCKRQAACQIGVWTSTVLEN